VTGATIVPLLLHVDRTLETQMTVAQLHGFTLYRNPNIYLHAHTQITVACFLFGFKNRNPTHMSLSATWCLLSTDSPSTRHLLLVPTSFAAHSMLTGPPPQKRTPALFTSHRAFLLGCLDCFTGHPLGFIPSTPNNDNVSNHHMLTVRRLGVYLEPTFRL
jgi:hypothetical protein